MSGIYDDDGVDLALPPVERLKILFEIDLGNEEMQTADDVEKAVARALLRVRHRELLMGGMAGPVSDINGNRVGGWTVIEDRRTTT